LPIFAARNGRYNVALYDKDSGETVSSIIIGMTLDNARALARDIVNSDEERALAKWWNKDLTSADRYQLLEKAGIKLPERVIWSHIGDANRNRLAALHPKATLELSKPPRHRSRTRPSPRHCNCAASTPIIGAKGTIRTTDLAVRLGETR
jgi:hypothetical protein